MSMNYHPGRGKHRVKAIDDIPRSTADLKLMLTGLVGLGLATSILWLKFFAGEAPPRNQVHDVLNTPVDYRPSPSSTAQK